MLPEDTELQLIEIETEKYRDLHLEEIHYALHMGHIEEHEAIDLIELKKLLN